MGNNMLKPKEIYFEISEVYEQKANYPIIKSIVLGIFAGAFIAFGGYAAAAASHSIENYGLAKLVAGAIFPVGLIIVLIAGTDLFTGNTLLTILLAEKKIKIRQVIKNWSVIYIANFVGALFVATLIYYSGLLDGNSFKLGGYALKTAIAKASLSPMKAFLSGILCNILVCTAVWLSCAAKDIAGKIAAIWFPIMAFIIGGFEHSVANMYYFSAALLAKNNSYYVESMHITVDKLQYLNIKHILINNIIPVTLGNIVGGGLLIGIGFWIVFSHSEKK